MTFRVRWSEAAVRDFEAALSHIHAEHPPNARIVQQRILKSLRLLETFSLGRPAPNGLSKLFIPRTSYFVIFHRAEHGDVEIRAFIHAARDFEQVDWSLI